MRFRGLNVFKNVGLVLLGVALAYPAITYFSLVQVEPSSKDLPVLTPPAQDGARPISRFDNLLTDSAPTHTRTATAGAKGKKPTATKVSEESSSNIQPQVPAETIRRMTEELARYSALIDYLKIFLPSFSFLVISVLASLGFYFVQSQVLTATAASRNELSEKADEAEAAMKEAEEQLKKAKEEMNEVQRSVEERVSLRLDSIMVRTDHALSVTNWRLNALDDAILYGTRNEERLETLVPRAERRLERELASEHPEDVSAEEIESQRIELEELKAYRATESGSIAYFYAQRYQKGGTDADRVKALEYVRKSLPHFHHVKPAERLQLIDCYLYAMSPSAHCLLTSEKELYINHFFEYGNALEQLLDSAEDRPQFEQIRDTFRKLSSELNAQTLRA